MVKQTSFSENGFTLIELMIVILIISVLVSMAVFSFRNTAKIELRTCQSNLRIIDGAIFQYYLDKKVYPAKVDDLVPKYIKTLPKCPQNDALYQISGTAPNLSAYCPNEHAYQ